MAITDINLLKNWFRNRLKPPQEQFWAWMDSYWHKNEKIPTDSVENLTSILNNKTEKSQFEAHLTDSGAHSNILNPIKQDIATTTNTANAALNTANAANTKALEVAKNLQTLSLIVPYVVKKSVSAANQVFEIPAGHRLYHVNAFNTTNAAVTFSCGTAENLTDICNTQLQANEYTSEGIDVCALEATKKTIYISATGACNVYLYLIPYNF